MRAEIEEVKRQNEGVSLLEIFKEYTRRSDCSSAKRGGDLGVFRRGEMVQAFEDAAFGLPVGKMSEVVETASGCHLIFRYV